MRFFLVFLLSVNLLAATNKPGNPVSLSFAGAKGAAIVSFTCSMLAGISNFIWSFDWTRAGATDEQNKKIQEAGGIGTSAVSFLMGTFILWAYYYLLNHPPIADDPNIHLDPVLPFENP